MLSHSGSFEPIVAALLHDEDWRVRLEAVVALPTIADAPEMPGMIIDAEREIHALVEALGDKQVEVRLQAAYQLTFHDGDEIRREIFEMTPYRVFKIHNGYSA